MLLWKKVEEKSNGIWAHDLLAYALTTLRQPLPSPLWLFIVLDSCLQVCKVDQTRPQYAIEGSVKECLRDSLIEIVGSARSWQILCRWKLCGGFHVDIDVDVVDIDVNVDVDVDVVFVVIPKPLRNFPCTNKYVSSI